MDNLKKNEYLLNLLAMAEELGLSGNAYFDNDDETLIGLVIGEKEFLNMVQLPENKHRTFH